MWGRERSGSWTLSGVLTRGQLPLMYDRTLVCSHHIIKSPNDEKIGREIYEIISGAHTARAVVRTASLLEVISSNRQRNRSRGIQMLPLSLRWVAENVEAYWRRKIQFFSGLITVIIWALWRSNLDGKYQVCSYIKCW